MQFYSTSHYGGNDFVTFYEAVNINREAKPLAVCTLLDISKATLKRYLSGQATPPKSAVRLLFHECHYGRSATDAHAHQGHVLALRHAKNLQAENDKLLSIIKALELENDDLKRADHAANQAANSSRYRA